jgi:hypothetical protein
MSNVISRVCVCMYMYVHMSSCETLFLLFTICIVILSANRVTTMHDFGYVALNMKYVYPEDSGSYTCRATNELGQAVTSSTLVVHCK